MAVKVTVTARYLPAELGRAYVGTDGLEGLYGAPEKIVEAIVCGALHTPHSALRIGWGKGKFVSWVAATRAKPGAAVIVPVGGEAKFLASQPLAVLPLDPDTHRRLLQLGVKTLGALVALPEEAVVSQFGRAGRQEAGHGSVPSLHVQPAAIALRNRVKLAS